MKDAAHMATWVSKATKERFAAVARHEGLSDSALLRRLVEALLQGNSVVGFDGGDEPGGVRGARVYVRLRPDDQVLLRDRAARRGMRPATYVSVLVRAHLRKLPPVPKDELVALKRSVAELGAIGRNLNQLARAAHQDGRVVGPGKEDLRAFLKVCEGLRDNVKGVIRANVDSWEMGHAEG
jgi:hypothetical protein